MLASKLKQMVRAGELALGPFLTFDFWPGYLEIFKAEGMDYAVLDMEHGSASLRDAEELCRVARLLDFPLLIRPEGSVFHQIRKYIDMGAAGFMLPWVESQSDIDTLRKAAFLPPKGRRGPGGPSVLANRTLDRAGWDEIEENLFLMIQIESPTGLQALPTFRNWDWVDAVMVGPYDLALNLDRCGDLTHPEVVAAISQIHATAANLGKPCGMVIGTAEQADFWINRGFRLLITSEPSVMVRSQVRTLAKQIRESDAKIDTKV